MRTIFVTGASRGLGFEIVKQYSDAGWEVLACCRDVSKANNLQAVCDQSNGKINIFQLDVTDCNQAHQLSLELKNKPIDILMNVAGIYGSSNVTLEKINAEEWLDVFKVNTIAPLIITQVLIENVIKSDRKIIANMSSMMGSIALNSSGSDYVYRSSKAALNSAVKTLACELKSQGITVVALHPGWVRTDMGGPNGLLDAKESINGIRSVLETIGLQDTGSFIDYTGEKIPW